MNIGLTELTASTVMAGKIWVFKGILAIISLLKPIFTGPIRASYIVTEIIQPGILTFCFSQVILLYIKLL